MDIANAIAALLQSTENDIGFEFRKTATAGTPVLWEERFALKQKGSLFYLRRRCPLDAGGAAIGKWSVPASPKAISVLAQGLQNTKLWQTKKETLLPGAGNVLWETHWSDQTWEMGLRANSPQTAQYAPLELLIRRMINALVESGNGKALVCEFDPHRGQIQLFNPAKLPVTLLNPLCMPQNHLNYLRVEVAQPESRGAMDSVLDYKPVPFTPPAKLAAPFDREYLQIGGGQRLLFPATFAVSRYHGLYVRAVYSNYLDTPEDETSDLVRGRVFSKEELVE